MASASSSQRRVAETALNGMQWGRTKALGELDTTAKLNALYIKTIRQLIALGDYQAASIYQESLHKNLLLSAGAIAAMEETDKIITRDPLGNILQHYILQSRSSDGLALGSSDGVGTQSSNSRGGITNDDLESRIRKDPEKSVLKAKIISRKKNGEVVEIPKTPTVQGKWTAEEHAKCVEAMTVFKKHSRNGRHNYEYIAKWIGGSRTKKQVRDHIAKMTMKQARQKRRKKNGGTKRGRPKSARKKKKKSAR